MKIFQTGIFSVGVVSMTAAISVGCQTRTVVYTSPAPRSTITYVRKPARVVTNTVYVKESGEPSPTTLPGAPRRLPEAPAPASPPATAN